MRRGERRADADQPENRETSVPDPTAALVQALDRLRATAALRPADTAVVRMLRGMRHYHEETRHGVPVVGAGLEPPPTLPPVAPA